MIFVYYRQLSLGTTDFLTNNTGTMHDATEILLKCGISQINYNTNVRENYKTQIKKKHHREIKIINNTDPTRRVKIIKYLYFAKLWIQINTNQVRGYIVITIGYSVVCMGIWTLSVTWCMLAVVCGGVYSLCYLRQHCGYLPVTWGMVVVVCKSVCVLFQIIEAGWRLSVSYTRQDDGYLSVTWGRMIDIYQLHEAAWSLSVSYMRQVRGYLSVTWGRMTVIC